MEISFPGGLAVAADHKGFTIVTDQPVDAGGENTAPAPFDLFLASLGTCAGYFALRFCRQRQLPTEGLHLSLETDWNAQRHRLEAVRIRLKLPAGFPEKYREAIVRAAEQCTVKRTLFDPPEFAVTAER